MKNKRFAHFELSGRMHFNWQKKSR